MLISLILFGWYVKKEVRFKSIKGLTHKKRLNKNTSPIRALEKAPEIGEFLDQKMTIKKIHEICKRKGYIDCSYSRFAQIIKFIREQRDKRVSLADVGIARANGKDKPLAF